MEVILTDILPFPLLNFDETRQSYVKVGGIEVYQFSNI